MTVLLRDIRVFFDPELDVKSCARLSLQSGLDKVLAPGFCQPYAFLPSGNWRLPSVEEAHLLLAKRGDGSASRMVGLIRAPERVVQPIDELGLSKSGSQEELDEIVAGGKAKEVIAPLVRWIASLAPGVPFAPGGLEVNGFAWCPAGKRTVTIDRSRGDCYVGLHLDGWDRLPLARRSEARNRICVNLSKEDRYLLFINLTMGRILEILQEQGASRAALEEAQPRNVVARFLENNGGYPVCRLRVAPGEAYLAPTENMIHDGSSLGMSLPTVTFTVRGRFSVGEGDLRVGTGG